MGNDVRPSPKPIIRIRYAGNFKRHEWQHENHWTCHQSLGTFVLKNSFNATVDNGQQSGDIYVGHLDAHGKPISAKLLPRTGFMTFDPPVAAIGHRGNLAFGTHVYTSGSLNLSVAGLPLSDGTRTLLAKLDLAHEVSPLCLEVPHCGLVTKF